VAVAALHRLGTPIFGRVAPAPYPDHLRLFDAGMVEGNRYALDTRWLAELSDDTIGALGDAAVNRSSAFSVLLVHHFHGVATRIAPDATAFAVRQEHLLVEVIAGWPPGPVGQDPATTAAPHQDWVGGLSAALAAGALPGGYPNILGPQDGARTRLGFGPNAERLSAIKRRYDPDGVFSAIGAITPGRADPLTAAADGR
jgi:hypothetical protein